MSGQIRAFFKDFLSDGYAIVGIIAAPASVPITSAKFFNVPVGVDLSQVSYAWALAPLLVWFVVAYIRRRHASTARLRRSRSALNQS
jgi:hypothetical protein